MHQFMLHDHQWFFFSGSALVTSVLRISVKMTGAKVINLKMTVV